MNEKIIDLVSKPLRFVPSWVQGAGLGLFLAHVLENNPGFKERLEEIDDNYFLFEATDIGQKFYLYIKDNNITVKIHHKDPPDVIMKGEFSVLVGLLMSTVDPDNVFSPENFRSPVIRRQRYASRIYWTVWNRLL